MGHQYGGLVGGTANVAGIDQPRRITCQLLPAEHCRVDQTRCGGPLRKGEIIGHAWSFQMMSLNESTGMAGGSIMK